MGEADTINKRCPRTASTAGGVANTRGGVLTMSNVTCRVDDCDARVKARGLCPTHYSRWRRNGTLEISRKSPAKRPTPTCEVDACDQPAEARGWCHLHYDRWRRNGDVHLHRREVSPCAVEGCQRSSRKRGWCEFHYGRWRRTGQTSDPVSRRGSRGTVRSDGYVVLNRPEHPLSAKGGLVMEHRSVLYDAIGPGEHECHWCSTSVSWERTWPAHADALVVDHVDHDRSNNDRDNLVPSCQRCNANRGSI